MEGLSDVRDERGTTPLEGDVHAASEAATGEEALAGEPEVWEPWETQLVLVSLAIGAAALLALGWLVDRFILS